MFSLCKLIDISNTPSNLKLWPEDLEQLCEGLLYHNQLPRHKNIVQNIFQNKIC